MIELVIGEQAYTMYYLLKVAVCIQVWIKMKGCDDDQSPA